MSGNPKSVRRRVWLTILALPVYLIVGEIAARVWVAAKYTPERIEQLTTHSWIRGRFASHPYLPFALNPDFKGHNALGFRGGAFELRKPAGVRRIVCLGASTTYGSLYDPEDSYPAQLGVLARTSHPDWEVINGGVLGTVSTETLIDLEFRVLPVDPDVVVIMSARNELFPQLYNRFSADYTHFRRPGFSFPVSNYLHKELFRWSRLAMLACTVGGERFGWSEREEHPLYGGIVWENEPTAAEAIANANDPARLVPFRRNLESMVQICKSRGIRVLLGTMAIRQDRLELDELPRDPQLNAVLSELVDRDNELIREVGRRCGVAVAETGRVSEHAELFLDDAHLTLEGHRVQARIVQEALAPLIEARTDGR